MEAAEAQDAFADEDDQFGANLLMDFTAEAAHEAERMHGAGTLTTRADAAATTTATTHPTVCGASAWSTADSSSGAALVAAAPQLRPLRIVGTAAAGTDRTFQQLLMEEDPGSATSATAAAAAAAAAGAGISGNVLLKEQEVLLAPLLQADGRALAAYGSLSILMDAVLADSAVKGGGQPPAPQMRAAMLCFARQVLQWLQLNQHVLVQLPAAPAANPQPRRQASHAGSRSRQAKEQQRRHVLSRLARASAADFVQAAPVPEAEQADELLARTGSSAPGATPPGALLSMLAAQWCQQQQQRQQ